MHSKQYLRIVVPALLSTVCLLSLPTACYKETEVPVHVEFSPTIVNDNFTAPVQLKVSNTTTGADFYQWTFDGGEPSGSTEKVPGTIVYRQAGTYTVKLKAWSAYAEDEKTYTFAVDSAVQIGFKANVLVNNFAPAMVSLTNTTTGASTFQWTFEGGNPATSNAKHPEAVRFEQSGEHLITLVAGNGRESFTTQQKVQLDPPLAVDFDIEPSFDDFDYEVPFIATLRNKSTSGLTYKWTADGGTIAAPTAEQTTVSFSKAGTYTVTLTGDNLKEQKSADKKITVKANTNLYAMTDVKFGVKAAASTLGSFYSLDKRSIILQSQVDEGTGSSVSLLFFGINSTFSKCYFASPTETLNAGFYPIPSATTTYIVNTLETSGLQFTAANFDAMNNDTPLRALNIRQAAQQNTWFVSDKVPRIVLFETADGRKGAIKIKAFVPDGEQSHILTDLKFQKQKAQ